MPGDPSVSTYSDRIVSQCATVKLFGAVIAGESYLAAVYLNIVITVCGVVSRMRSAYLYGQGVSVVPYMGKSWRRFAPYEIAIVVGGSILNLDFVATCHTRDCRQGPERNAIEYLGRIVGADKGEIGLLHNQFACIYGYAVVGGKLAIGQINVKFVAHTVRQRQVSKVGVSGFLAHYPAAVGSHRHHRCPQCVAIVGHSTVRTFQCDFAAVYLYIILTRS